MTDSQLPTLEQQQDFSSSICQDKMHWKKYVLLLLSMVPLILACIFLQAAFQNGTPGFRVDKTQKGLHVSTVFRHPNPVQAGDLIIGINGYSYPEVLGQILVRPVSPAASRPAITLLRNQQTITVKPHLFPVGWSTVFSIAWPHFVLIFLFLFLGILALFRSDPAEPAALFFCLVCSFSVTFVTTLPSHFGLLQPAIISLSFLAITLANWLSFACLAHFTCCFPRKRNLCADKPWMVLLLYIVPPVITLFLAVFTAGVTVEFFSALQRFRNVFVPLIIVGSFAKHLFDLRFLQSPREKNQVKLIVTAYWLSFAPYLLFYLLPNLLLDKPLISFRIILLASTILPMAYLIGLMRYRLLGVDRLISRTLAYFFTVSLLTLCYAGFLVVVKRWFFGRQVVPEEIFLLFLLGTALSITPLVNRFQRGIDRAFFRYRPSDDTLLFNLSQKLSSTLQFDELVDLVIQELPHSFQLQKSGVILVEDGGTHLFPETLPLTGIAWEKSALVTEFKQGKEIIFSQDVHASRQLNHEIALLQAAGFALALPLQVSGDLCGILLLGERKDGRLFREDDVRLLATLANQLAVALKNSIHYTSMIKNKEQLEVLFSKVVQTEKMAALGEMSATLAHEIKNPLSIIRSSAQYLVEKKRSEEINEEMLSYIIDEVDGITGILSNILGLARFKPPDCKPLDLRREIPVLCQQWQYSEDHRKGIQIHTRIDPVLPVIYADCQQIRQVLLNLLRNSEDALAGNGNIYLTVSHEKKVVVIRIEDDGPGIAEEHQDELFGKFFTTHENGLGLGLTVCKQIIDSHHGKITIANRKEGGAVICISLPLQPFLA